MHTHDNDAFASREPTAKRIFRVPKHPIGIHQRWSADGHDKLYKIGFPIWAIVDDATGRWLDAWVVPSNRTGDIVAYLFLCVVEKYSGMSLSKLSLIGATLIYHGVSPGIPLQFSTDCGSETTKVYGIVNAFR